MHWDFSILPHLSDDRPYQGSPAELRILASELELHGMYQIQFWRREADHGGQIEIVVTYETQEKKK